jgi:glycosyltransferase involved in cell wall biosynthesis
LQALRVLFAPDYRAGVVYQELLAAALALHGIEVLFLSHYRRGLPLSRGARAVAPDVVHLHWPEKYFSRRADSWDRLRVARYPFDCWLTANYRPLVLTAHNLLPHDRHEEPGVLANIRYTARKSEAVFVHSQQARTVFAETFGVSDDRLHVIPFGDHAVKIGMPIGKDEARAKLGLPAEGKVCLVFGMVSPYKGSDQLVRLWAEAELPHRLAIVGPIVSNQFATELRDMARGCPDIDLRFSRDWLDDEVLRAWLSAADCTIFNYRKIFTSGAAALARSFGVPILIPSRLETVDLHEPHPHVFRFKSLDTDFFAQLERALATPCNYELARGWREQTCWERVAAITAPIYRQAAKNRSKWNI